MSNYWQDRESKAQDKITQRNAKEVNKQIAKYYSDATEKVISSFVGTYEKILVAVGEGKKPTPADLYKLDSYWKAQAAMRDELQKLGNKQAVLMSEAFEKQFLDIYKSISLPATAPFAIPAKENIIHLINTIWTADGRTWSERIWKNGARLAETLNEELVHCVITGKKTTELKDLLQERFNVSFGQADTLVRTEMSHIQNISAHKRYTDAGVEEFEVWASEDERRCEVCGKLHKKKFPMGMKPPIPAHPNCRCAILPVIK